MDLETVPAGMGSGFVWDLMGHIVTNNHGERHPFE